MKPAPFHYADPATLDEALALLGERGPEAAILAGGQTLVPLLNARALRPEVVIDINGVPGLERIEIREGSVVIGALARARALERDGGLAEAVPVIREALRYVAVPQVRARTTFGGSVAHADPAAELPAAVAALDGEIELASRAGRRALPWDAFFRGPFSTARRPDELVVGARLAPEPGLAFAFAEAAQRRSAPALVGACVGLARENGAVRAVRIALCGIGDGPLRLRGAEEALTGSALDDRALPALHRDLVARLSSRQGRDREAAYRAHVGATLVGRGLHALWEGRPDE